MAETEIEEAALQKEKSNLMSQLPVQIIRLYERISKAKNGIAVAKADDGSCSGCHTKLPSAKLSELKRYDSLVHCDVCSRILAYKLKDENNK
jgi:predicted  nucleic acid-binding Zn-ribbon protein